MTASGTSTAPCSACKLLRRRCTKNCVFSPYFPNDQPNSFANVHKIFGASNVAKMLQDLPEQLRSDAVTSLAYEADARVRDPIYGCVGSISILQQQVAHLQHQLDLVNKELEKFKQAETSSEKKCPSTSPGSEASQSQVVSNEEPSE